MQERHTRGLQHTYFISEEENKREISRLVIQDRLLHQYFGGTLPEQENPFRFLSVLDLGCGPGVWLMDLAKEYPHIRSCLGVDINPKAIDYAKREAPTLDFEVVDVLQGLPYQANSFDLVNMRLAMSFIRTWDWLRIVGEMHRVVHPDGVVRIVESSFPKSDSEAHRTLMGYVIEALYQAGHLFAPEQAGVVHMVYPMLKHYSMKNVQKKEFVCTFSEKDLSYIEDSRHFFLLMYPFLRKWIRLPETYMETYTQMMHEITQPGCKTTCTFTVMWGEK